MHLKCLLLCCAILFHSSAAQLQCHVQGQAIGVFHFAYPENSYNECLSYCHNDPVCTCFTYNSQNKECFEFSECQGLDQSCSDCYSGESDCPIDGECNIQGLCNGQMVDYGDTPTEEDCLFQCKENPSCQYYAYEGDFDYCTLLEDCPTIYTCQNCRSGKRNCSLEEPFTILMVVGGYNNDDTAAYDVELVDFSGQGRSCGKPFNYPGSEYGSVGAYVNAKAIVCGGYPFTSDCYIYVPSNGTWNKTNSQLQQRNYAVSTVVQETWWTTGGFIGLYLKSTEVYDYVTSDFAPFMDLPAPRDFHNLVKINESFIMLLGGQEAFNETFLFDVNARIWTQGPSMLNGRRFTQAGLVTFDNGTKVVIVTGGQGLQSTEVLNLEEGAWSYGVEFPHEIYWGNVVQLENTFIIVGGHDGSKIMDTMWKYDTNVDDWILMPEKLSQPKEWMATFLVPDSYCQMDLKL